jgi:hypothetical protein
MNRSDTPKTDSSGLTNDIEAPREQMLPAAVGTAQQLPAVLPGPRALSRSGAQSSAVVVRSRARGTRRTAWPMTGNRFLSWG